MVIDDNHFRIKNVSMKRFCYPFYMLMATGYLFLSSCGDKSTDDPVIEESSNVVVGQVKPTSFTVAISGTYKNISKADIALGKHGVLYCPKSDKSGSIFQSWKNGNDNVECSISAKGTFSGESYSCSIDGLYPDTEYDFCLFFQNKDNTVREISSVYSFTTASFSPKFEELKYANVHYIDAEATISVSMDTPDVSSCTIGIIISQSLGVNKDNVQSVLEYSGDFDNRMTVTVSGLKPDSVYYCRPFAKYKTRTGDYAFVYGPENSFATISSEQMYVDLELPSGIKWSKCNLGDNKFEAGSSTSNYQWGMLVPFAYPTTGIINNDWYYSQYKYYNRENDSFINIGNEISGTEYDAAKAVLGGKWRMPTKADVDELIANCDLTKVERVNYSIEVSGYTYEYTAQVGDAVGNNGNTIQFMLGNGAYWCGTVSDNGNPYCFVFNADYNDHSVYISGTGRIQIGAQIRINNQWIRPVWDPNMPD